MDAVLSEIDCSGEMVIDGLDYPVSSYIHLPLWFFVYHLDLLPPATSILDGISGPFSSGISEYAFLFVRLSEMSVGCLSLDIVDRAPVL